MDKWEKLKQEIIAWKKDCQTEEEAMAVSIFLEMIEHFEKD
jgi:hypothetical protein